MLIQYKVYPEIPPDLLQKLKSFSSSINAIKEKCLIIYNNYAIEGSTVCLQINRSGEVVKVDKRRKYERNGLMDLWVPPKMPNEEDSYV